MTDPTSHKAPPAPESRADTRARLLAAALDVFGRQGYEGASTRTIAAEAGCNLASIPYHFGGKQGLYLAVAQHIADEIAGRMGTAFAEAAAITDNPATPPRLLRQLLFALVDRFADMLLGTREAALWARFVIREQMDPSPAFDVIFNGVMRNGHTAVCRLFGRLMALDPEANETKLRVFAIIGQILVFRAARAAVLRRLDWDDYTPGQMIEIKAVLRTHVTAILDQERRS